MNCYFLSISTVVGTAIFQFKVIIMRIIKIDKSGISCQDCEKHLRRGKQVKTFVDLLIFSKKFQIYYY